MENIEGKIVVITGASSGLGAATARRLAKSGARVALGARRADRLQALVAELGADKAMAFPVDVTVRQQVAEFVAATQAKWGRIDAMLHNAGIMPLGQLGDDRWQDWAACIDVNLKGVIYGLGAVLPIMKAQKSGHNLLVSSVAGHRTSAVSAVYSATKFGVRALAEGLRQEVKAWGGRTTILSPGAVATELARSIGDERVVKGMAARLGGTAVPADSFARCVAFAISQPDELDINEILFRPTTQMS